MSDTADSDTDGSSGKHYLTGLAKRLYEADSREEALRRWREKKDE